jgi:hypothetical protein
MLDDRRQVAGVNVGLVAMALNFAVVGLASLAGLTFRTRRKLTDGNNFYTDVRE